MATNNTAEHVKKYDQELEEYVAERRTINGEYVYAGFQRQGTQLHLVVYTDSNRNNPISFRINETSPQVSNILNSFVGAINDAVIDLKDMRKRLEMAKRSR